MTTKALILRQSRGFQEQDYHDVVLEEKQLAAPHGTELVVKMHAVAFNHREVSSLGLHLSDSTSSN